MENQLPTHDTHRRAIDQATRGDLQDVARIANELQQSHGMTRADAMRAAREIITESRKATR